MAPADPDPLEQIYRQWSPETLARALTIDQDQYEPEAVPAMKRALESYGLSQEQLRAIFADLRREQNAAIERLARIRGVLLLFIVAVAVTSVIELVLAFAFATEPSILYGPLPLLAVPFLCLGAYGLYCCVLLLKRNSGAPQHARGWLMWNIALVGGLAALLFLATLEGGVVALALAPAMMGLVGLTYLSESKRVAFVYGPHEELAKVEEVWRMNAERLASGAPAADRGDAAGTRSAQLSAPEESEATEQAEAETARANDPTAAT